MKPVRSFAAIAALGLATALVAACRTYPVDTDWDRDADFAHLGRYAWTADQPLAGHAEGIDRDVDLCRRSRLVERQRRPAQAQRSQQCGLEGVVL